MPKKKSHKKRFAAPKFVQNADELQNRNNEMASQQAARRGRRLAAGCDDDDLKDDGIDMNDTQGDDGFLGVAADMARMKMEQEEALEEANSQAPRQKKKGALDGLIEVKNPNARQKTTTSMKDLKDGKFQKKKLTRREREQFEKEAAERRYWKAMENGTHEQAKKDKKRLEEVRKRREEAKKKKEKEAAERAAMNEKAKEAAQAKNKKSSGGDDDDEKKEVLALDKVTIKKMKPAIMKEHLKTLGLSTQGNKKTLEKRLLEACGH